MLHVHVLPENEDGTGSSVAKPTSIGLPTPFSWLEERHMQVSTRASMYPCTLILMHVSTGDVMFLSGADGDGA